jgi:anthranilate/para-aminobenzoate synthase component I
MNMTSPSKQEFLDFAHMGTILPLSREMSGLGFTPLAALEALRADSFPVILESARMHETIGRYSFVAADPYLIFKSHGNEVELNLPVAPTGRYGKRATMRRKPLQKLQELLSNYRSESIPGLPPFTGGAIGFFSYNFARLFMKLPEKAPIDLDIPESYFIFVDMVVAFDHILNRVWVIVNPGAREQELGFRRPDPERWDQYYDEATERLETCIAKLTLLAGKPAPPVLHENFSQKIELIPELSQIEFESMVRQCKEFIAAGDIFRANLSQRFSSGIAKQDPFRLYVLLRKISPSPFAAYLDFGDIQLVSSAPERLINLRSGIQGADCLELFRGKFPGEAVTGSPKARCMEIIDKLEPVARGPYAGSIGYLSNAGEMDFNIITKTFIVRDGMAYFHIGTQIAAESDAAQEYAEMLQKVEALKTALARLGEESG